MSEQSPESSDSPVAQAYRQYLRTVKEAWSNLDVEALDLKGISARATLLATTASGGCAATLPCWGIPNCTSCIATIQI